MATENFSFEGSTGARLAASVDWPDDGRPRAWALFAHCFTCSRLAPGTSRTCKALAKQGIAGVRFDFTGLGQSEGDFTETTFLTNVADLVRAYEVMEERFEAPSLLAGHSLGGAAALRAAQSMPQVKAVVTMGTPFDPARSLFTFSADEPTGRPRSLTIAAREIPISDDFVRALTENAPESYLPSLRRPLLILHSPTDQVVGIDNAQRIFQHARYPKSLVSLDGADHRMTRAGAAQRAADVIRTWAEPYLPHD